MDTEYLKSIIQRNYEINEIVNLEQLEREAEHLQKAYIVKTISNKYFLKCFNKSHRSVMESIDLNIKLNDLSFPSVKVAKTKDNLTFILIDKLICCLYQYFDEKETTDMSKDQAKNYGETLARLHLLTNKIGVNNLEGYSLQKFKKQIDNAQEYIVNSPKDVQTIFNKVSDLVSQHLEDEANCFVHGEFSLEHVRFNLNEIKYVLDWDGAGLGIALFDLGSALYECIKNQKLDLDLLEYILEGYVNKKPFSTGEIELFYDYLILGCSKYFLWGLGKDVVDECGWPLNQTKCISNLFSESNKTLVNKLIKNL